jgi:hypothetical protein
MRETVFEKMTTEGVPPKGKWLYTAVGGVAGCAKCGRQMYINRARIQADGRFAGPTSCQNQNCGCMYGDIILQDWTTENAHKPEMPTDEAIARELEEEAKARCGHTRELQALATSTVDGLMAQSIACKAEQLAAELYEGLIEAVADSVRNTINEASCGTTIAFKDRSRLSALLTGALGKAFTLTDVEVAPDKLQKIHNDTVAEISRWVTTVMARKLVEEITGGLGKKGEPC